ncbi:MAG: fibronectin type III domain-containing protein, partial [Prevotella sp.]|nr:fibronectin type III domain-containing protein [Prevotella sp.]
MKPLITHLAQATMISAFTMTRRMAVMLLLAMFVVSTTWADGLTGTGTADAPYLISSDADWNTFASNVNNGTSYSGKTVKLTANINVSTMAGTSSNKFKGTFDGAGHKINLALTASEDRCAPFRYVDGATICMLTVTDTVSTGTYKFGAGLIAESHGSVTVKNCRSSVTISGDRSSLNDKDGTHGGFVSLESNGSLTFINCLFDGSISDQSATNCGGFVGWRSSGSLTFTNCLMAGTLNIDVNNNSATFNRNGSSTLDNSYYITSYGAVQGTDAGSMSNETLLSNLGSGWELINNKVVPSVNTKNLSLATIAGLRQNYIYTGSAISLAYVVKDYDGNTLVNGTHYDVTITKDGSTVSEVKDKGIYTLTITVHDGSGYTGSQSVIFEVADYVEIGDPESSGSEYYLPVNMLYESSLTQQIFTAEEIGAAGTINSLSFEYLYSQPFSLDGIQIYMKTVGNKSSFSNSKDMVSVNASDKVWEGTFSVTGAGWVTINLDTPFSYDGTENLLVCFYDPVTGSYPGSSYKFRVTNTTGNMAISYYSDDYVPDLNDLSNFSGNKYAYGYRNNIRFDVDVNPIAFPSSLEVTDITAHEATLTWAGGTGTYNVEYKKKEDTEWTSAITNTKETSLTLTNLAQDAEYVVRVQSVKGEKVSSWKKNNFTTLVSCPIPTNLAVTLTEGNATEATLSWTENGSATLWEICLNDDETSVITATTNPYTVKNLTPEATYTAKVRAVNSDEEKSNWSDAVTFEPTEKRAIGIGAKDAYEYLPFYNVYNYSLTQQIYTAEEFGEKGLIESIDFKSVSGDDCTRNIDIYMVSTDKTEFDGSDDLISVSADDLVFSGEVDFVTGSWTEIVLDQPFLHDGVSNVALIVDDNTGSYMDISNYFLVYKTENVSSSIYLYDDDMNFNPANPEDYDGYVGKFKNAIRLRKSIGDVLNPTKLVASDVRSDSVKLSWKDNCTPAAQKWVVAYKTSSDEDFSEITVSENPFVLTGLTEETEYIVKVRPVVDGETIIKWSHELTFVATDKILVGIGTEDDSEVLPFNNNYNYSLTQQIYTAEEFGEKGWIKSIDFKSVSGVNSTRNIDIYMVSTDKTEFDGSDDLISVSADDRVFSGEVDFVTGSWTEIVLDNPFYHDGVSNVALIVDDNTGDWVGYYLVFSVYKTEDVSSSIYDYNDGKNFDPVSPEYYDGDVGKFKNAIRLRKISDEIQLANDATDNATLVETYNGKVANVTLTDRTLYKDGKWNTICLPFDVEIEGSVLEGAVARRLTAASVTDNETSGQTLHLTFGNEVTDSLKAGVPYIIKWEEGDNITDPVFPCVTISNTYEGFDN